MTVATVRSSISAPTRRLRILVLTSTFPRWPDDTEPPFVWELSRRIAAHNDVVVLAPHFPGAVTEDSWENGLRIYRFRYAPQRLELLAYQGGIVERLHRRPFYYILVPFFLLAALTSATRIARQFRPDLIHAHWILPQGILALLIRFLVGGGHPPKVVCTSHGADMFALRGKLSRWLKRLVVRHIDGLSVVSRIMREEALRLGGSPDIVRVMPMGIDASEKFVPSAECKRVAHEILFVGRLVRKKGVETLIEAFAELQEEIPGIRLLIVGTGPLEDQLRKLAVTRGLADRVHFVGAVRNEDLPSYYRRAGVFVAPSVVTEEGDQEGLGLTIAEAMACECPVVASALPAIRDLIDDRRTGLLAAQANFHDLAKKIRKLVDDPDRARDMAGSARQVVMARFDWSSVSTGYVEWFHDVCESGAS